MIVPLLVLLVSCKNPQQEDIKEGAARPLEAYWSTAHLMKAESLMGAIDRTHQKIIDFRKNEDYEKGHIPGALQIYRPDIEDSNYPYKGIMASKEKMERLFSDLGITNSDTLVVYDDKGGSDAARLWWVFQNYDYGKVKVLDGGLRAWKTLKGPLETQRNVLEPSNFKLPEESSMSYVINKKELEELLATGDKVLILDVRSKDEHSGKRQKSGASKAGRIPRSKLIDWSRAIDYHGTHKFLTFKELEELYGILGASREDTIVTYCHTGVRSAHTTFVLKELLGYSNVKNYDGSWSEWSYFEDLPFEKDSSTLILQ